MTACPRCGGEDCVFQSDVEIRPSGEPWRRGLAMFCFDCPFVAEVPEDLRAAVQAETPEMIYDES